MADKRPTTEQVLDLARQSGVIRVRDLTARGIHPEYLRRLCNRGLLLRVARGVYVSAEANVSLEHTLALAAKSVPHGVVCLLSALRFHDLGTQDPHQVWLAIDRKARLPRVRHPRLRIIRASGEPLTAGVEEHTVDRVPVRIYSPAKTVADCFKYRNKIGLDVALEALRDCWRGRRATMDELWQYAKICRMTNVMRPYLESLT